MTDILIIETGNGGDAVLRGNDFANVDGCENSPYLSMFGGNNWWGNVMADVPYNSQTEAALNTLTLSSAGRVALQAAIESDLAYLSNIPGTTWTVTTSIGTNPNQLVATININGQQFNLIWNPDTLFLTYQIT